MRQTVTRAEALARQIVERFAQGKPADVDLSSHDWYVREIAAALTEQAEEIDRLRSEAGYHDAKDVIEQLTAQRDDIQAATWEAALRLLADHEDHNGAGNHGRTDGRVSDCIGDLEQVFRAAAQGEPK